MASVTFIYMVFIATVQQQCCHSYKLIVCELESGSVVCVYVCVCVCSIHVLTSFSPRDHHELLSLKLLSKGSAFLTYRFNCASGFEKGINKNQ